MDPRFVIERNFPRCDNYDDNSFLGKLHEHALWAQDEYWLLEWALYQLAKDEAISEDLSWQVFRIFSHCFLSFGCHLDRNDFFKIRNLKRAQLYDCRERFQMVFEGFFSRNMPEQKLFEEENPLLLTLH
ncbi:hypothetical protein BK636_02050 [Pseudomonas chlororaphis]|uniref:Imm41 family immunity protein n=1 Tax=Pseudomonas chlororaphis TaxID=587753 RepID=UPI000F45F702|nr:Imm41 family immunity protein [Pseudomonas chlororaphis]ROL94155.1 hypothetical protein BK636_02050 [Pseudomonas chlororaphis]